MEARRSVHSRVLRMARHTVDEIVKRSGPIRRDSEKSKAWANKRRKRINPFGKRKKRWKEQGLVDGDICAAARKHHCWLTGAEGPCDPHHTGPVRLDHDPETGDCWVMPLHWEVHRDWHQQSASRWLAKYGFSKPTPTEMRQFSREFGLQYEALEGDQRP